MIISGGDWSYTDLREISFGRLELTGVNFEGAQLNHCQMARSSFRRCNFNHAWMTGVNLEGSDVRGSTLEGVDLKGIRFRNTKIDLEQAVALAAALGARYTP